ncbi:aspartyl-tRNA(Asn)/glutamyl-tRNA(Gln) amidotransferase subunit A [Allokutzneria albata]|uniref:Aspartyl-tRNA(Asn)/glutamyl-tRNA(Gln) amidotransferase subunit A n=2 Tax=Allokutzneria albata TaxID=211114 RepID=A0A1H0DBL6_ALLAB|nr:aspartyl-tRNA(Asn)/glutamyl-tRNA(Gln) amidotransferase subunit A [Allokutzneria albata]
MELADLSAVDAVAMFRSGAVSPVEMLDAVLSRVDRCEPVLRATYSLDAEGARAAAKAAEQRWRRQEPVGALDGVPVTIKENVATKGTPVPLGTAATELVPADADGPAAARLREEGAVIIAKTTMPDYGMLSSGLSSFHATARNPWDTSKGPGGSSAGAGAAGAAGYGPLHVGTDIGGSIRLPAGWCALVGLKPTFGRVPVDPPYPGRVVGPMTRTAKDAALMMSVLSKPDSRDHLSLPPQELDWRCPPVYPRGLRIGLQLDAGVGLPVHPEIAAAVTEAARAFEAAGAAVEPIEPIITREMLDGLNDFWRTRFWSDFERMPLERREKVLPYIREWVESGADLSGVAVYRGYSQMDAMAVAAERALRPFDYVLSPVSPVPAFAAELPSPTNDPLAPFEHIGFTVPYNMSGQPAVSVNCGFTSDGLPIGLQIAGHRFNDAGVLGLVRTYERIRPAQPDWPKL